MNIQLTNRIKQNARSFSKGQRLIAKYIEEGEENPHELTDYRKMGGL